MASSIVEDLRSSPESEGFLEFQGEESGGRVPPHSVEAEQSALGAILLDNEVMANVLEIILPEDFYSKNHQVIFRAMLAQWERGEPIDIMTLSKQLRAENELESAGGVEYLSRLVDIVPTSANSTYYARTIKEGSIRRRLIHEASKVVEDAFKFEGNVETLLDDVESRFFTVSESRVKAGFTPISEVVQDSIKEVERLYVNQDPITGVATGFTDLDSITFGLQPSDLIILAGRPSMGKTALALSMVRHISLEDQKNTALFSLEMSKDQIVMRLLCAEARVSNGRVRSGKLGESDFPKLVDAASKISSSKIFIDDTPALSVLEMRAKARRLHRENPLSLIVVDYLQLMRAASRRVERREQEISEISRGLKALAKELSVPVIAVSQLNRAVETRNDKRPLMADLRESGAIEQDADIIGFVYRDEVYNPQSEDKGVAELIIGKHRNGEIGTIRLAFHGEFTSFENLAEDREGYDYLGEDFRADQEDEDFLP